MTRPESPAARDGRGRKSRPWGPWLIAAALIAAVWFLHYRQTTLRLTPPEDARPASPLELLELDGSPHALADHRGQVVLVNLWASWCAPCRREVPLLSRLRSDMEQDGLVVLGVNFEDLDSGTLRQAAERLGIAYPVLRPRGRLGGTFAPPGVLPYTWLVDRQGRIRAAWGGLAREAELHRVCRLLLDE